MRDNDRVAYALATARDPRICAYGLGERRVLKLALLTFTALFGSPSRGRVTARSPGQTVNIAKFTHSLCGHPDASVGLYPHSILQARSAIIEIAKKGEREPDKLCERVLSAFGMDR